MLLVAAITAPVLRSVQSGTSFFGHTPHSDDAGHAKRRSLQTVAFAWTAHPKARPALGAFEVHVCATLHALPFPHSAVKAAAEAAANASSKARTRGEVAMIQVRRD
jgi:hypothetical protein